MGFPVFVPFSFCLVVVFNDVGSKDQVVTRDPLKGDRYLRSLAFSPLRFA